MRFPLTARFVAEAERHALRHECPHCFHFVDGRCASGWPLEGQERVEHDLGDDAAEVVFCREFELA